MLDNGKIMCNSMERITTGIFHAMPLLTFLGVPTDRSTTSSRKSYGMYQKDNYGTGTVGMLITATRIPNLFGTRATNAF